LLFFISFRIFIFVILMVASPTLMWRHGVTFWICDWLAWRAKRISCFIWMISVRIHSDMNIPQPKATYFFASEKRYTMLRKENESINHTSTHNVSLER
jgi:hypothetical protein